MQDIDELLSIWERRKESGDEVSAEELCRDCPELLPEVELQIRALRAVESHFGETGGKNDAPTKPDAERVRNFINVPLSVTSRFRIERHHASGGLGDVFVALDPALNRRVAVKIPRASRMSTEQRARFEREARVTGRLDHPGIVAVHALKQDDSNQPCYVMRFVEGPTLHDRCKELHDKWNGQNQANRYATMEFRRLLEQFVALCNIVAYAHTQQVIHRDIKPANVILGPFGEVLLMDWGLARVDGEPVVAETNQSIKADSVSKMFGSLEKPVGSVPVDVTKSGQILGTPAFAAPEQLLGHVQQIDQRSDVFSLGATLCFMLSGEVPVERSALPQHLERISSGRGSPFPDKAGVPRALSAICQTATASNAADRYQSAVDLADDIRRYLANEPVSVMKDSLLTRVSRWMRKHPVATVSGSISTLLLLLFSAAGMGLVASYNSRLESTNDELAIANRNLSQASLAESAARGRAEEYSVAAREAVEKYLVHVTENKQLKASDFTKLRKELLESAKPFLQQLCDQAPGDVQVESSRARAFFHLADIQQQTGELAPARTNYNESAAVYVRLAAEEPAAPDHRKGQALCCHNLGMLLLDLGEIDEARSQLSAALKIWEQLDQEFPGKLEFSQSLAGSHGILGSLFSQLGERPAAKEQYEKALKIRELLARDFPDEPDFQNDLAHDLSNLGGLLQQMGDYKPAAQRYGQAVEIAEQLAKEFPGVEEYRMVLGASHNNFGSLLNVLGEREQAQRQFAEAIRIWETLSRDFASVPEYKMRVVNSHYSMADLLTALGDSESAEKHNSAALAINELLVRDYSDVPDYHNLLANLFRQSGNLKFSIGDVDSATSQHQKAVEIFTTLSVDFPEVPEYRRGLSGEYMTLARLHDKRGEKAEARKHFERVLPILGALVNEYPEIAAYRDNLAACYNNLSLNHFDGGELELAHENILKAVFHWEKLTTSFPDNPSFASSHGSGHSNLGLVFNALGNQDAALDHHQRSLAIREKLSVEFPNEPHYRNELAVNHDRLGMHFAGIQKTTLALEWFGKEVAVREQLVRDFPEVPDYFVSLGWSCRQFGNQVLVDDPAASLVWFLKAESLLKKIHHDHPNNAFALKALRDTRLDHANALDHLARHAEAADRWRLAAELFDGDQLDEINKNLARTESRARQAKIFDEMLDSDSQPESPESRAGLAGRCYDRGLFLRSALEYKTTMLDAPESAPSLRYSAACAAILAATGKGTDTNELTAAQKTEWRQQSLAWLNTEFDFLAKEPGENRQTLEYWMIDRDLKSVRDADANAALPETETKSWQEFWAAVKKVIDAK